MSSANGLCVLIWLLGLGLAWPSATVFVRRGDPMVVLTAPRFGRWFWLRPQLRGYTNAGRIAPWFDSIRYLPEPLGVGKKLRLAPDSVGTRTYAWCPPGPCIWARPLATPEALAVTHAAEVTQVVVRGDDSFLGYLQELLQTPFVLLPRRRPEGHQTDLRLGSDCAALVGYGRRRMGESIDYRGPQGLLPYLVAVTTGEMRMGDVLHYGEQVQVVFDDRGRRGQLDGEDMVLQSWLPFPRVVRQDASGWAGYPVRIMRFRTDSIH